MSLAVFARKPTLFNVKDYGAKLNGTTDDTTAVVNAVASAVSAGGGRVWIPGGTLGTSGDLPVSSLVDYDSPGLGAAVVKLLNGSTKNVFKSDNFDSLTGGTSNTAPYHFAIRNLLIDGNKANCPSGLRGIALYGYEYAVENVLIRNTKTDGFYTEFAGDSSTGGAEYLFEESHVSKIKVFDSGGHGVWNNGPHDSMFYGVVSARNGSTSSNFRLEGKSGNYVACHGWGNALRAWHIRGQENLLLCQGESALETEFYIEWHDAHLIGCRAFYPLSGAVAFRLGDSTHSPQRTIIDGCHIYKASSSNVFAPAIDFTYAGIQTVVRGSVDQATGTVYAGAIPADADVDLRIGGGATPASFFQKPGYSPTILRPALEDTFAGADSSVLAAKNWTTSAGSAAAAALIQGQRATLLTGATGSFSVNDNTYLVANTASFADGEVLLKVELGTNTTERYLFVGQRASATNFRTGTTNAYWFQYQNNTSGVAQTQLNKRVAGANTNLQQSSNFSPTTGSKWWLRFRAQGSLIAYKWWADGTAEPNGWTFSTTDTAVTAANPVVIYAGSGSAATAATSYLHYASVQAL